MSAANGDVPEKGEAFATVLVAIDTGVISADPGCAPMAS